MGYDLVISNATVIGPDGPVGGRRRRRRARRSPPWARGLRRRGGRSWTRLGKVLIPGGIDVHVHLELPFCGTTSSDDWESGTRAAARGVRDDRDRLRHPLRRAETLADAFANWSAKAGPKACVDYAFHMAITELGPPRARDGGAWSGRGARPSRSS